MKHSYSLRFCGCSRIGRVEGNLLFVSRPKEKVSCSYSDSSFSGNETVTAFRTQAHFPSNQVAFLAHRTVEILMILAGNRETSHLEDVIFGLV